MNENPLSDADPNAILLIVLLGLGLVLAVPPLLPPTVPMPDVGPVTTMGPNCVEPVNLWTGVCLRNVINN